MEAMTNDTGTSKAKNTKHYFTVTCVFIFMQVIWLIITENCVLICGMFLHADVFRSMWLVPCRRVQKHMIIILSIFGRSWHLFPKIKFKVWWKFPASQVRTIYILIDNWLYSVFVKCVECFFNKFQLWTKVSKLAMVIYYLKVLMRMLEMMIYFTFVELNL